MKYKILVTGGAGFIGSHLVDKLIELGHDVVILDNLDKQVHPSGKSPSWLNKKAKFIKGDILDKKYLKKALDGVEVIFHKAAAVGVGQSMYQLNYYIRNNCLGTSNLLEYLVNEENDVKKLIVAASMSEYGEGLYLCEKCGNIEPALRSEKQMSSQIWELVCPTCGQKLKPMPTPETKTLHCNSIYAQTKKDQEEMCLMIGKTYGINVTALRYFNVYGPRQSLSNPYTGVAAIFMSRVKNNNPPIIFEDGLQTRDFIYVKDIVKANILAMKSAKSNLETFNIGSGKPLPIVEMANTIIKSYNSKIAPTIKNKFRKGDVRHCYADLSKSKKKLDFSIDYSFEKGMAELISWAHNATANDKLDNALEELQRKGLA